MREILKNARVNKGFTQKQLAERLGIGTRMYQYLEAGDFNGSIKIWDKLEDLFKIPQRQLRENTDIRKEDKK